MVVGQNHFQRPGQIRHRHKVGIFPAEGHAGEFSEVANGGLRLFRVASRHQDRAGQGKKLGVVGDDVSVRKRLRGGQGGGRDDQAHGPEVAEPFLVREEFGVVVVADHDGLDLTPSSARDKPGRLARPAAP